MLVKYHLAYRIDSQGTWDDPCNWLYKSFCGVNSSESHCIYQLSSP